ncbi:MAG: transporter substrate-binding domain-containing protein [Kiritimatiellae bacterium]|nr:transporter substrate-binding domain-containing protein [Kiritimatiellia bacterium]
MSKTLAAAVALAAALAPAAPVKVADCVRDPSLDYWAAADSRFSVAVMERVFAKAGIETERVPFGEDGMIAPAAADVICSAFRTDELLENYDFPLQPMGRMHYALYATPSRAMSMMSVKITDWPRLRVGYSPVSQGQCEDRQRYFSHAKLDPEYVEYRTSAGAVKALNDGEIDALFLYTPFGKRPEGVVEIVPIGDRNVYFAVRKDRGELMKTLNTAFREFYIDGVETMDRLKETILGIPKPERRVRVAAYSRGDMFSVTPDGEMSGALLSWMRTICGHTRWTLDYVYGGYDESLADVAAGRLDLIAGIGFSPRRRDAFLFPHTPIGMIRVYLWAHPGSRYRPGRPSTWSGMKLGILSGSVSADRVKRQLADGRLDVKITEFSRDGDMLAAYFGGEIDACVDVEMPELAGEVALHVYTAHPMYICVSAKRADLFDDLEIALETVCEDSPKYRRMVTEHRYGRHSEMAALTMEETEWLAKRVQNPAPIVLDFSPWPFPVVDEEGNPDGLAESFIGEMSRRTGLNFALQPQTGIQTAEARFMRGETDLWVPYPAAGGAAVYGAAQVYAQTAPPAAVEAYGCEDPFREFEMYARRGLPPELVSIMRKTLSDIDQTRLGEMVIADISERNVEHRLFGLTGEELKALMLKAVIVILAILVAFATVMGILLKRQASRANRAAREAENHAQAKTRFLAMMSHELRTPLNAVIGFAEFIARGPAGERQLKEYTDGILLSSNALLALINDILDLSKLEAGAMAMLSGMCDMDRLLKELPAIFGYRVRKHGVVLRIEAPAPGEIPLLALSQEGMRQILLNLVGNSAKFTEQGEIVVAVGWDAQSRTLRLEIRDTGRGISREKMDRLFDPFVQDIGSRMKSNSGEVKGTGLGLPIVKRLVDAAGGTIGAESAPGKGTRFTIELPNLGTRARAAAAKSGAETIRQVLPDRVLVVDDMAMNRKILGIHLGNMKIKDVRFAENGCEAMELMKEWTPDLVLTDMWMPEMDGTQLAEAMHRERSLAEIPVVAVTADVDVGSTYDMTLFAKVISKPVTGEKLKSLFGDVA